MPESWMDMLSQSLPRSDPNQAAAILGGLIVYLICFPFFFRRKSIFQNVCTAVLFAYAAAVLESGQCLIPPTFQWEPTAATQALSAVEWNPLHAEGLRADGLFRSLAVLMPVGLLAPPAGFGFRPGKLMGLSALCGVGLEALQLLCNILTRSPVRSVCLEDAVLQAAGCLLVSLALAGLRKLAAPKRPAKHYARSGG